MKLHYYLGLLDEEIPYDVTHVIVDDSVRIIREEAFVCMEYLVSVIMADTVEKIEDDAFRACYSLKYIRISKTLRMIGDGAFYDCTSLEILILPSSVILIEGAAFGRCQSLRILILSELNGNNCGDDENRIIRNELLIHGTAIQQIAEAAGVQYRDAGPGAPGTEPGQGRGFRIESIESIRQVNEWLIHHMDGSPFHKLCYRADINAKQINDYLNDHGNQSTAELDPFHGMTPLHMLAVNPHAPVDALAGNIFHANMDAAVVPDNHGHTPLDYAKQYNVPGLLKMIEALCMNYHISGPQPKQNKSIRSISTINSKSNHQNIRELGKDSTADEERNCKGRCLFKMFVFPFRFLKGKQRDGEDY